MTKSGVIILRLVDDHRFMRFGMGGNADNSITLFIFIMAIRRIGFGKLHREIYWHIIQDIKKEERVSIIDNTVSYSIRILGIDPGFGRVGFGIIEGDKQDWRPVVYGCIETDKTKKLPDRLFEISEELNRIIKKYHPTVGAVEELFFYTNITTAIHVAEARGTILLSLRQAGLEICEYTPLEIKQAVTGHGRADKQQIQRMVQMLLQLKKIPKPDDAADALAVALTCAAQRVVHHKVQKNS